MSFKVTKTDNKTSARLGILKTPHGDILTPCFMPCGTHGTVKTVSPDELKDLGVSILLGNTYHLYLRPGDKEIKKYGSLNDFMKWDGPILTDSGGYQVFSLSENKVKSEKLKIKNCDIENSLKIENYKLKISEKNLVKITEEGVLFKSHLDGSNHLFTPEKVIDIQRNLGSDIMMVLDECTPYPCSKEYAIGAMNRTHNWALRALNYKTQKSSLGNTRDKQRKGQKLSVASPLLFGIIQGSTFKDLREKSARFITSLPFDGIAIGGVSVGEGKGKMYKVLDWVMPILNKHETLNTKFETSTKPQIIKSKSLEFRDSNLEFGTRPVYLMGVGTPEDILEGVEHGIDMFDCVLPTRLARHGTVWIYEKTGGKINLLNSKYKNDKSVLMKSCQCYSCRNGFSRGYIQHLLKENEVLGIRLMTLHNLHFILDLTEKIRYSIGNGTFTKYKNQFLKDWKI